MFAAVLGSIVALLLGFWLYHTSDMKDEPAYKVFKEKYPFHHTYMMLSQLDTILDLVLDLYRQAKGNTFTIKLIGQPRFFFVSKPEIVEHVLKTKFDRYGKGPFFFDRFEKVLGRGIFAVDGIEWYVHRKISSHLFSSSKFKGFIIETFHSHCDTLCELIREHKVPDPLTFPGGESCVQIIKQANNGMCCKAGNGGGGGGSVGANGESEGDNGLVIDAHDVFHRFTLDSIGEIAFGTVIGALRGAGGGGGDDVCEKKSAGLEFAKSFDYCQYMVNESFFDPLWRLTRLLTPQGWKFYANLKVVNEYAYKLVRERRQDKEVGEKADLLSLFLGHKDIITAAINNKHLPGSARKDDGTHDHHDHDHDHQDNKSSSSSSSSSSSASVVDGISSEGDLSDRFLRDVLVNMIIAGRDTTAQAVSWAFLEISQRPEVQHRIRSEVNGIIKNRIHATNSSTSSSSSKWSDHPLWLTYDEVAQLKYTDAVFMETLRLYPSVPKEVKYAFADDCLPDGTRVPKGSWVSFCPWVMGRMTEIWGDDCLEFNPDRFYGKTKPSPFVFTAFQAGPRTCLGQQMAMLEAKVLIARLVFEFDVSLACDKSHARYMNSLTLPMRNGLPVRFVPKKED